MVPAIVSRIHERTGEVAHVKDSVLLYAIVAWAYNPLTEYHNRTSTQICPPGP